MLVHLSAEYYPYARTGGLAEAAWGLHRYQARRGLETAAILPLYRVAHQHLHAMEQVGEPYTLHFGDRAETLPALARPRPASETPTYFIQHDGFFDRAGIYGEGGRDYPDNHRRFAAFAAAAVAALAAPDRRTGPAARARLARLARRRCICAAGLRGEPWFDRIPVVLSVHNGGYQGHFGAEVMPELGLPWSLFHYDALEWYGKVNLLKGGLTHADMATTVSPAHAVELLHRRGRLRPAGRLPVAWAIASPAC